MPGRRVSFALLLVFAFLTPAISAAYVVFGLLLAAWAMQAYRERRLPETLRSPFVFIAGLLAGFTVLSAVFSLDPAVGARHLGGLTLLLLIPITMDLVDSLPRARTVVLTLCAAG